jgi:hypothetical protein
MNDPRTIKREAEDSYSRSIKSSEVQKRGGYTPEYEKLAPTASEMSPILEIHFSDHLIVG